MHWFCWQPCYRGACCLQRRFRRRRRFGRLYRRCGCHTKRYAACRIKAVGQQRVRGVLGGAVICSLLAAARLRGVYL